MEKRIEQHSSFIGQIIPPLVLILVFGAVLLWQYKNRVEKSIIVAKEQVLQGVDLSNDSSVLATNKQLKALSTDKGLDSLINNIK
jgi:hypothetical protein